MNDVTLVWVVRAGSESEAHGLFIDTSSIGARWSRLGNLNQYANQSELAKAFLLQYSNITRGAAVVYASQLFNFAHAIKKGDSVIYPVKQSKTVFVGCVTGDYQYNLIHSSEWPHLRKVNWLKEVDRTNFSKALLQRIGTPAQLSVARLRHQELSQLGLITKANANNITDTTGSRGDD